MQKKLRSMLYAEHVRPQLNSMELVGKYRSCIEACAYPAVNTGFRSRMEFGNSVESMQACLLKIYLLHVGLCEDA